MGNTLIDISNGLADITQAMEPHIVSVRARRHYPSGGFRFGLDLIVTADHAVRRDEDIAVTLSGGKEVTGTLLGRDGGTDLAVLKIETAEPLQEFSPAAQVRVGELALVLGRSPDSGINASLGIVSATSGPWRTWRGGQLDAYIRLDATLFPQSSGGAVVNTRGEIIGIATSALSRIAGLAIPFSTVKRVVAKLVERGFVPHGYFGVGVQSVELSEDFRQKLSIPNASGLIVLTVEPKGPADRAGILVGDILVGAGDAELTHTDALRDYCDSLSIGTTVQLRLIRGGSLRESALTVGERPRRN